MTDQSSPFDTAQTDLLLTTTRAVRRRLDLDRPVEPAVIHECLRLAVQAPTASNSQTWRWMVVADHHKRARIAQLYAEQHGVAVRPEQVILTCGASPALVLALSTLFAPGARVALARPG